MNYKNLFNTLLLEFSDGQQLVKQDGGRRHPSGQDSFAQTLDDGTDPEAFLTQGLKASVEAVQQDFNRRMTNFANTLSPQAVKTMTIGRLKDEINNVFKYVNGIQVFMKAKIDVLAQNPSAILAAFIASDPAKQAAFEGLHKDLEEFNTVLEETQASLSMLKGKIDEFVDDISGGDPEEAAQDIAAQQNPEGNQNMGRSSLPQGGSQGSGRQGQQPL